ncbi:hypothetical protein [Kytococcus sp. Marseille-QA3725]
MGFLDRILGGQRRQQGGQHPQQQYPGQHGQPRAAPQAGRAASQDDQAIARYQYLLRTAPPERIEEAHAEAFARLTPDQRRQVLGQMAQSLPVGEAPRTDDPRAMARAATRAEMSQPGYMQRTFGGRGAGGVGMGGTIMGPMMGTIAGVVVGSAVADAMFDHGGFESSPEAAGMEGDPGADGGDLGADAGGFDSGEYGGGDLGGDPGGFDFGGDFGGGDFGGDF